MTSMDITVMLEGILATPKRVKRAADTRSMTSGRSHSSVSFLYEVEAQNAIVFPLMVSSGPLSSECHDPKSVTGSTSAIFRKKLRHLRYEAGEFGQVPRILIKRFCHQRK